MEQHGTKFIATNPVACWDLTADGKTDLEIIKDWCKEKCKKWCLQRERGEKGYEHYQMRVSLANKVRCLKVPWNGWEMPTLKENLNNYDYVTKECTRIDGPWKWDDPKQVVTEHTKRVFKNGFLPFQEKLLELLKEKHNDRTINIVVDVRGNKGKSVFAKYCG